MKKITLSILVLCLQLSFCIQAFAGWRVENISVFFNHNPKTKYREPYRGIERAGDNLEAVFLKGIEVAQKSIDLAVMDLRLPLIAKALAAKSKQGVQVRIVLDNKYSFPLSALTPEQVAALPPFDRARYDEFVRLVDLNHDGVMSPEEIADRDSLVILHNAGVKYIDDTADGSKGSGIMHHKFMVVDGKLTFVSSANLTTSDVHGDFIAPNTRGNTNALVVIDDIGFTKIFSTEFAELWSAHFGLKKAYRGLQVVKVGSIPIAIQFSPTSKTKGYEASTNGFITREVLSAKKSASMALFVFSEQAMANALQQLSDHGGSVRTLIEPLFANRYYSELLDMFGLAMLNPKCTYEKDNMLWTKPIKTAGIPNLPTGDFLHHKFAVIDHSRVIFGSHNWSNAANRLNDETLIDIANDDIAAMFEFEFQNLYDNSLLGPQPWLLQKIKDIEKSCGKFRARRSVEADSVGF